MHMVAGSLSQEFTLGGIITIADDEMVPILLLQAKATTEAGHAVTLYNVYNTM